jgi:hypothetical protein
MTGLAGKKVVVCGILLVSNASVDLLFEEGDTASTCTTPGLDITGAVPVPAGGGYSIGITPFGVPFGATAGRAVCLTYSGSATIGGWVSYGWQ